MAKPGWNRRVRAKFDLLIVDIMLPHKDGWDVVTELRRDEVRTPILFLTARDSVRDRVKGLELGADDYLVKPFAFSELLARVRSVLRRAPQQQAGTFAHRGFGTRYGAAQGNAFRRSIERHAEGISSARASGSLNRRCGIARRNCRTRLGSRIHD